MNEILEEIEIYGLSFDLRGKSVEPSENIVVANFQYPIREPMVVGCWGDTKPIYRVAFQGFTPTSRNVDTVLVKDLLPEGAFPINYQLIINNNSSNVYIGGVSFYGTQAYTYIQGRDFHINVTVNDYLSKVCYGFVEYVIPTDPDNFDLDMLSSGATLSDIATEDQVNEVFNK